MYFFPFNLPELIKLKLTHYRRLRTNLSRMIYSYGMKQRRCGAGNRGMLPNRNKIDVVKRTQVGIAGGGIIGLSAALELADAGLRVTVFERGRAMAEASSAAAGM